MSIGLARRATPKPARPETSPAAVAESGLVAARPERAKVVPLGLRRRAAGERLKPADRATRVRAEQATMQVPGAMLPRVTLVRMASLVRPRAA